MYRKLDDSALVYQSIKNIFPKQKCLLIIPQFLIGWEKLTRETNLSMTPKKTIEALFKRPVHSRETGIDYFRHRLLFYLLLSIAVFGSIAYLPSVYYSLVYQYFSVIIIDTLALAWVFVLLFNTGLSFYQKSLGLLAVFYLLGVLLLVSLGPTGAGFLWLLLFSIMAGVLLGYRPALISFGMNLVTLAILSVLVFTHRLSWELLNSVELAIWTVKGVNFICINAIVSVSIGFLITKISQMAKEEQEGRQTLSREMESRIQTEEENRALTAQLYQSQKMEAIGTLAGGVAHDFNNILSAILGYTELSLLEKDIPSPLQENLVNINRAGQRARDIVKQIQTFSRHAPANKSIHDIGSIAKECLEFARVGLPPGIDLVQTIPETPLPVLADRTKIHQVFMNLLTNGIQAMDNQKGTLSLTIQLREDSPGKAGKKYIRVSVTDTGIGIQETDIPRLFEPYFTTKEFGKGTGMGLAISHGIIKAHAGEITVESRPGLGSSFMIHLPRHHRETSMDPIPEEPDLMGAETLLLVDDEPGLVDIHTQFLTKFGYQVATCTDPLEALDLLRQKPDIYDLVITDQKMPGMTGNELRKQISQVLPDLPVVLCSGFTASHDGKDFQGVLTKPVNSQDLAGEIRRVLDKTP